MTAASLHPGLFQRAWRWHFLAAAVVVPFVLWQSVTGVIYLWADAWVDARHPSLRFVTPAAQRVALDAQLETARGAFPGASVMSVRLSANPRRSTQVIFTGTGDLPRAAFVNPYTGKLLGALDTAHWPAGWSRQLHGGWPLGAAGSWLLELGACWTIVMVLTGLYLWWPRDGRPPRQVLLPRLHGNPRRFWRDLHACVAVWCSALIILFLFTALPWTEFWGDTLLATLQRALGQQPPSAAGFAPVFGAKPTPEAPGASLQALLDQARMMGVAGELSLIMVDGPPGAALSVRSVHDRAARERYVLLDRADGRPLASAQWGEFPPLARAVATGVDIHEGSYFGRLGPWLNTALAAALTWLAGTGLMAWWRRKPARALGIPTRWAERSPRWVYLLALALCTLLPMLALSVLALWLMEKLWSGLRPITPA